MNPSTRSELSLTGTFQKSQWNASGEIPLRAVQDGSLDRFGAIDPSEGGKTIRSTARLNYHYDTPSGGRFFANAYGQYYRFDLFTNFTFFLNDPVNGDGIQQSDRRVMYGGDIGYQHSGRVMDMDSTVTVGVQTRVDDIHARLGTQTTRNPLGNDDRQRHSGGVLFAICQSWRCSRPPWMRLTGGVRSEVFTFDVRNRCPDCPEQPGGGRQVRHRLAQGQSHSRPLVPHGILCQLWRRISQQRCPLGRGAGIVAAGAGQERMRWGSDQNPGDRRALSSSPRYGRSISSPNSCLSEMKGRPKFAGRPGGVAWRWRREDRSSGPLYFNGSVTWSQAEFTNGDAIPLAPELTGYGALILRWPEGLTSQLQATYLGVRPLTEDRSIKSPSWLDFDLSERYQIPIKLSHGRLEAFFFIQNLFNTKWEQAVFAFESRLRNEAAGVTDIHFVPGNPRFVMGGVAWYF